jgi:hypothetical protein
VLWARLLKAVPIFAQVGYLSLPRWKERQTLPKDYLDIPLIMALLWGSGIGILTARMYPRWTIPGGWARGSMKIRSRSLDILFLWRLKMIEKVVSVAMISPGIFYIYFY